MSALYAIGGSDGSSPLASVEQYSKDRGTWIPAPPLGTAREAAGVATLDGAIFAVGGSSSGFVVRELECT